MSSLEPFDASHPTWISAPQLLALARDGAFDDDEDRVELLEGVIVSQAPASAPEASCLTACMNSLMRAIGDRASIRVRCGFAANVWSIPVPDVAVVPRSHDDYWTEHPSTAHLIIEAADRTLAADRLSKSRIYAAANVPEYWIVNLRDFVVEVMRDPDPAHAVYRDVRVVQAGDEIELAALPGARVAVAEILPKRG